MQPEYGMLIGWFSCPTRDCNNEWDKHWIADIYFMDKVHFENPHYSAFLNGTLLIKKVLPMYDERYFIMRVRTGTGDEPNIYHLKVVQGNVYLLVILFYMLSPCVLLATWLLYQYFSFFLKPVSRAPSFDTGQSTKYICLWRDGRFSWSSGEGLPLSTGFSWVMSWSQMKVSYRRHPTSVLKYWWRFQASLTLTVVTMSYTQRILLEMILSLWGLMWKVSLFYSLLLTDVGFLAWYNFSHKQRNAT